MIKLENNGIFIVFDGVDGAGKTTQVNLLAKALEDAGESVIISKEPTDGEWGRKIRATAMTGRLPIDEELEAFVEDRKEHINNKIKPALAEGKVVILDRYLYSTIAYQGVRSECVDELETKVKETALQPDIAFIIDIDPRIAAIRITDRDGGPDEFEKLDDQIKIRSVFDALCKRDETLTIVDGSKSIKDVNKDVVSTLIDGVLKNKRCFKNYGCDEPVYCGYRMSDMCDWWSIRTKILEGS